MKRGLATVFSEDIIEIWFDDGNKQAYTNDIRYRDAAAKVRELLAYESNAIRLLKEKEPAFKRMTADTFVEAGLVQVPQPLINELLKTF